MLEQDRETPKLVADAVDIGGANAGGRTRMAVNRQILSLDESLTEVYPSQQINNIEAQPPCLDSPVLAGDGYKIGYSEPPAIPVILSRGLHALVDAEDYDRVSQFKWTANWNGYVFYAVRVVRQKTIYLHRFILGAPEGIQVDHRDCDGLNCTRRNLRTATQTQNNQNRRKPKTSRSKFKGVDLRASGKWRARYRPPGRSQVLLGMFSTEEEAARAYDAAARETFGEFCRPNFNEAA